MFRSANSSIKLTEANGSVGKRDYSCYQLGATQIGQALWVIGHGSLVFTNDP
jgi:hypothetical protein